MPTEQPTLLVWSYERRWRFKVLNVSSRDFNVISRFLPPQLSIVGVTLITQLCYQRNPFWYCFVEQP